jgi:hypothetical protein
VLTRAKRDIHHRFLLVVPGFVQVVRVDLADTDEVALDGLDYAWLLVAAKLARSSSFEPHLIRVQTFGRECVLIALNILMYIDRKPVSFSLINCLIFPFSTFMKLLLNVIRLATPI